MKQYKQGFFHPVNNNKYKGHTPIVFRSSLELKAYRSFDLNPKIISWGIESVVVPYISPADGRLHRYFVDTNITVKNDNGEIKKYLIEIKPAKKCQPPVRSARRSKTNLLREDIEYAINTAKWNSAKQWADKNGYKFIIMNENHIENIK